MYTGFVLTSDKAIILWYLHAEKVEDIARLTTLASWCIERWFNSYDMVAQFFQFVYYASRYCMSTDRDPSTIVYTFTLFIKKLQNST